MERQISLARYRNMDLVGLCVIMAVTQTLISVAGSQWFPGELYAASPIAAVVALVMMRWNGWAAVHALLGGLLYALLHGAGDWQYFLIYGLGNLASMATLLLFRILDKEKIRKDGFLSMLYAFCVQLLMLVGRALVALLLGYPPAACIVFITTDVLSALLTVVAIWCIRRIEGLFEDQIHYLLRVQSERQVEGRDQF